MEGGLLVDVVVGQGAAFLQLLGSEDQPLLVRGDSFLVLDLLFDSLSRVRRHDDEGDGLARRGLDENLHATSNSILNETKSEIQAQVTGKKQKSVAKQVFYLYYS